MIVIEAIIKPFKLDDLKEALEEIGVGGMTITELMQVAPPRGGRSSTRGGVTTASLQPKIRVEIAVARNLTERVIEIICLHGSAGKTEDGLLYVEPLEAALRIRTGEYDSEALT